MTRYTSGGAPVELKKKADAAELVRHGLPAVFAFHVVRR
jgi:hypothetical protein